MLELLSDIVTYRGIADLERRADHAEKVAFFPRIVPLEYIDMRWVLSAKIHKASVTEADVASAGSITIDETLMEHVGLWVGEKVLVVSNTTGARLETYVIRGERDSGVICMNGAAAHLIAKGEEIIIMGFELSDRPVEPKRILVDASNRFVQWL